MRPSCAVCEMAAATRATSRTMVEFVRNSSAIDETLAQLEGYRSAARAAVAMLPDARARQSLDALVDYLAQRRN